jgi:tetratricopeptide (TPR) repeat protein
MSTNQFSLDWLNQFSDPYAVLGVSVVADERRILKRYHSVAKLLHPDRFTLNEASHDDLANQILARLVNPAYQQLKQGTKRTEAIAMLRFRARRLRQDLPLLPQSAIARRMMETPLPELDVFYEQAIAQLAPLQFEPIYQFEPIAQQLAELNLVYLHLKMGELIREKPTGIVSAPQAVTTQFAAATPQMANSYAQRHYQRAQEYAKYANWLQAVAELRDALRLEPEQSDYHALLAEVYWMQNLKGMAKVHFRQALKFDPENAIALSYATKVKINSEQPRRSFPQKFGNDFWGLLVRKR